MAISCNWLVPRHYLGIMDDILFSWMETCDEFDIPFELQRGDRRWDCVANCRRIYIVESGERKFITLFVSITMLCGTNNILGNIVITHEAYLSFIQPKNLTLYRFLVGSLKWLVLTKFDVLKTNSFQCPIS